MAFTTIPTASGFSHASPNGTPITTATTTTLIAAPATGKHLEILPVHASNSSGTSTKVGWKETSGVQHYETQLPLNGAISLKVSDYPDRATGNEGWHLTTATAFLMVTDAAGSIYWSVDYLTVND